MTHVVKTLPDQFLIENMTAYSGSYTDHYVYGNMFSSPKNYIETSGGGTTYGILQCYPDGYTSSVNFTRGQVAFTTQQTSQCIANSLMSANRTMWLSDYIQMAYGRYIASRTANYALQLRDESEYYIDSYTPNLFNMYRKNGGNYATNTVSGDPLIPFGAYNEVYFAQHYSGSRINLATNQPIEDFSYPQLSNSLAIVLTNLGTNYDHSGSYPYSAVDDNQWRLNYPYSIKYKNLGRNYKLSRVLQYPVTTNTNLAASATMVPLTSNVVSTVAIYTSGTRIDPSIGGIFSPTNTENLQFIVDTVISGSEGDYLFNGLSTNTDIIFNVLNRKTVSKLDTIQNVFFCLGSNGVMNSAFSNYGFLTRNFPDFLVKSWFLTMAPIIRGYKYGIFKANPTPTKAYWRRDHYGQFRDKLEQRQYSKFYYSEESDLTIDPSRAVYIEKIQPKRGNSSINIGGQAPVTLKFAAGSQAYLTASQYMNFDPNVQSMTYLSNSRESGIYDYEYRSAIPFEDRDIA